jgi:two-component system nitrate/nitrite sensor histidine kinase NarX
LAPAIERFIEAASRRESSSLHSRIEPVDVAPDVELALYQIAKEATSNAITHAKARNVWVTLSTDVSGISLEIRDDGVGFDPLSVPAGHYGLDIMKERASAIGAELSVETVLHGGTRIRLRGDWSTS